MAEAEAGAQPVPKLAARRPDWELPQLHAGLQLSSLEPLHANKQRIKCSKCGRSRAHYCYDCVAPLVPFPHVALPFRVSIVTHHEEAASKNTGVQVAILAAGQVDLHSMSAVPRDVDPSRCAVLFPSDDALEVGQLEPDSIDRLFIIDSRWKKAGELVRTETFRSMRAVKLSETRSAFWRFHTRGVAEEGVCTVEALYFFLVAMVKQGKLSDPRFTSPHAFDDLLWYFTYQHQVVQQAAQKRLGGRPQGQEPAQGQEPSQGQPQGPKQGKGREQAAGGGRKGKRQQQQQQQQHRPEEERPEEERALAAERRPDEAAARGHQQPGGRGAAAAASGQQDGDGVGSSGCDNGVETQVGGQDQHHTRQQPPDDEAAADAAAHVGDAGGGEGHGEGHGATRGRPDGRGADGGSTGGVAPSEDGAREAPARKDEDEPSSPGGKPSKRPRTGVEE